MSLPPQAQHPLGVAVHDLLHHLGLVAQLIPLAQDALVGQARVVAAKHDLVLQAGANVLVMINRSFRHDGVWHSLFNCYEVGLCCTSCNV